MTAKETMTYPSARLLKRARAGDRKAYDELFARVADRVLFFVRMRLAADSAKESLKVTGPGTVTFSRKYTYVIRVKRNGRGAAMDVEAPSRDRMRPARGQFSASICNDKRGATSETQFPRFAD